MVARSTPASRIQACRRLTVNNRGSPQAYPISSATSMRRLKTTASSGDAAVLADR